MAISMNLCGIVWKGTDYQTIPIAAYVTAKRDLQDDPRFRRVDLQFPNYLDYCAILSPEEAMQLVEECGKIMSHEKLKQWRDGVRDGIRRSTFVLAHLFEI